MTGRSGAGEADEAYADVRRRGLLLASGFLVGESFVGVLHAGADTITGHGGSLTLVGPDFARSAAALGLIVCVLAALIFSRLVSRDPG